METYPQFTTGEIEKFRKTVGWIKANRFKGEELFKHRKDFWTFVNEHDKRRGTDFHNAFPDLGLIGFRDETQNGQTKNIFSK